MSEKYEGTIESREYLPTGESGVGITGTWMNKRTGQTVNVRNSVMDGDKMIIITDKGQITMQEFSRDYIQASDEIYDNSGHVIDNQPMQNYEVDPDWAQIQETLNNGVIELKEPTVYSAMQPHHKPEPKIQNSDLIKKVFEKLTNLPEVRVTIEWEQFPEQQLRTLTEFLDVDIKDIGKYILKNYVNQDTLSQVIADLLEKELNKNN